ncbi:hypothetical protein LTR84_006060 [Exophiala bonariae]|uniref:Uncharacterized protein n=1 Tax=Exophiala bonariae TaxID=1690606 RepID=A0AAV9N1H3_9EURO|nr:hypothetical protein LTR84_006060 [Exophiala bonariae]
MTSLHPSQPDEMQILTSYLLHPSPLSTILPYARFQSLIPKSSLSHSTELKRLYRDLQFQRDITIDDVRRRIETECRRSVALQAKLTRNIRRETGSKRKRDDDDEGDHLPQDVDSDSDPDRSIKLDSALHGPLGSTLQTQTKQHNHSSTSLLSSLAAATADLTSEITSLEAELSGLRQVCEERVGGLSDLRYGRFSNSAATGESIEKEVTDGLEALKRELNKAAGD